jgi:hypothetical protein
MNLLDMVMSTQQNSGALGQIAKNFGLGESETQGVVAQLLPMLARGLQQNSAKKGGLDSLFEALSSGNHQQYTDNSNILGNASTTSTGNAILGHIFGSKDVSRNVAAHASAQTGISSSIIKKMLPVIASMAMGALSKNAGNKGLLGAALSSGNNSSMASSMIGSLLDSDNDGSVMDDLLGMAIKLF